MPAMKRKFQRSARRFLMSSIVRSRRHLAVVAAGRAEALVELLQQVLDLEVRRRVLRLVVAQQRERHADDREELAAGRVVHLARRPSPAGRH